MSLKLKTKIGSKRLKIGIGFEIYEYEKGKKMEGRHSNTSVLESGYTVSNNVQYDGALKKAGRNKQLVLVISTFDAEKEAEFQFKLWFKHK
jgi:hypothetical protein